MFYILWCNCYKNHCFKIAKRPFTTAWKMTCIHISFIHVCMYTYILLKGILNLILNQAINLVTELTLLSELVHSSSSSSSSFLSSSSGSSQNQVSLGTSISLNNEGFKWKLSVFVGFLVRCWIETISNKWDVRF